MHQEPGEDFESPHPAMSQDTSSPSTNEKNETTLESTGDNDNTLPQGLWLEGPQLIIVSMCVTLVVFLMLLDTNILSTAIPHITNEFHSLDDIGWYGSAFTISSATLQPLTGKCYTYFKSKWTFLVALAIFELGSLICGIAQSSKMLIIGRTIAGIGTSGILNGALNIIAGIAPMHKRPALLGIIMGISQLGAISGPLIGGAFTTYSTWRWCFYINLPIGGVVGLLLIFTRIPDQQPKLPAMEVVHNIILRKFDLIGFVLFAPASVMFLLALEWGDNDYAWNSPTIICLFCFSGVVFILFCLWENRVGTEAMIPRALVQNRIMICSCLIALLLFGITMTWAFYMPVYFQSLKDESPIRSGVDMLPSVVLQIFGAILAGTLTGRMGYYLPFGIIGGILNSVSSGLLSTLDPTSPKRIWAAYQALNGFGRGIIAQVPMVAVQNTMRPEDTATAMAILTTAQSFGGAIFLAVGQVIFSQSLKDMMPQVAPDVDTNLLIAAGATGFRDLVPAHDLAAVLMVYSKSINRIFYLNIGLSVLQFILAWGVGWQKVNQKNKKQQSEEAVTP